MKINSKFILFLVTVNLFSFSSVLAQFAPVRKYTNLTYHNNWSAEITFNGNPYMICKPNKVIGTYQITENDSGLMNVIVRGNLSTKNCQPAVDDGTGWIFQETFRQDKNELCQGRLELFDNVWLFDGAINNKKCSVSGKSYYIDTNSTSPDSN